MDPGFRVVAIPGKGLGVLSTKHWKRGNIILQEKPLFTFGPDNFEEKALELSADDLAIVMSLSVGPGEPADLYARKCNAYPCGPTHNNPKGGIFPTVARFNHSCGGRANASNFWSEARQLLCVYACCTIEPGDEMNICYGRHFETREGRQQFLSELFGFDCGCALCSLVGNDLRESDERRLRITHLQKEIEDKKVSFADKLRHTQELLKLLRQEGLTDPSTIGKTYLQLFIFGGKQNFEHLKVAYSERSLANGEEDEQVQRLWMMFHDRDKRRKGTKCCVCGVTATAKCSRCAQYYCSREHQLADYKVHKKVCSSK